jgi:riboflavin synthase
MFTGIVKDVGAIVGIEDISGGKRLYFTTDFHTEDLPLGGSVSCSGVCLSIISVGRQEGATWFAAELSPETLNKTTFGKAEVGFMVNLELPVRADDLMGGHIVTGHVDGVAEVQEIYDIGENRVITLKVPEQYAKYIASKGSVTLNGVSLTINEVRGELFNVNLIPITCSHTNLGELQLNDELNFEVDIISRYLERLLEPKYIVV